MNHNIPQYDFYKHKYGDELLIDVVPLNTIKKYLKEQPVHILTYYDITLITSGGAGVTVGMNPFNLSNT